MAIAKGNRSFTYLPICYKVRFLTEPILDATQICDLKDRYLLGEQLGVGQFGVIRTCSDRRTGESLACKSIAKDRLITLEDVDSVKLEIEILARLSDHPNIVGLKAVFEDEDYVHLVMELCAGGELFELLEERGFFSEKEAAVLFKQLMEVVMDCHEKGVVHRDLKPENILLSTTGKSPPVKLADFGLATYIRPGQNLYGIVGSPYYIAPEVLTGGYNQAADVWSTGVILYILLTGVPPFWGKTKSKIFDEVRSAEICFPPGHHISASAKDLIAGMLQRDPRKRFTAEQVLDHCWMKGQDELVRASSSEQLLCVNNGGLDLADVRQDFSPTFTCKSSCFSYLVDDGACSPSPCDALGSSNQDFISPVSFSPSFLFFSPSTPGEQQEQRCLFSDNLDNRTPLDRDLSFGNMLMSSSPASELDARRTELRESDARKEAALASRVAEVHVIGRRNRTIGLGEFEQLANLNIMVTGSMVRWSSFTGLSNTAPLQPSLVC